MLKTAKTASGHESFRDPDYRNMPTQVHHNPIKYGAPRKMDVTMEPPTVPVDQLGSFHPSFDNRLWLFGRKWEPPGEVIATMIILHGTVDHSGVYSELALDLVSKGIAVFASDMRGWGLSDGEPMYFHDLDTFVADVRADHERIHSEPRYKNVKARYILGKSLGGLIAAHTVARSWQEPISSAIRNGPVSSFASIPRDGRHLHC